MKRQSFAHVQRKNFIDLQMLSNKNTGFPPGYINTNYRQVIQQLFVLFLWKSLLISSKAMNYKCTIIFKLRQLVKKLEKTSPKAAILVSVSEYGDCQIERLSLTDRTFTSYEEKCVLFVLFTLKMIKISSIYRSFTSYKGRNLFFLHFSQRNNKNVFNPPPNYWLVKKKDVSFIKDS